MDLSSHLRIADIAYESEERQKEEEWEQKCTILKYALGDELMDSIIDSMFFLKSSDIIKISPRAYRCLRNIHVPLQSIDFNTFNDNFGNCSEYELNAMLCYLLKDCLKDVTITSLKVDKRLWLLLKEPVFWRIGDLIQFTSPICMVWNSMTYLYEVAKRFLKLRKGTKHISVMFTICPIDFNKNHVKI